MTSRGNEGTETVRQEAVRVLRAASEQIQLALSDSQPSVDALGAVFEKLAGLLSTRRDQAITPEELAVLRSETTRAVTGMQYHDRMTQHLSHVKEYLASVASRMEDMHDVAGSMPKTVHETLSSRLLSDTHRVYLGAHFRDSDPGLMTDKKGPRAPPGDIDLF